MKEKDSCSRQLNHSIGYACLFSEGMTEYHT